MVLPILHLESIVAIDRRGKAGQSEKQPCSPILHPLAGRPPGVDLIEIADVTINATVWMSHGNDVRVKP